MPKQTSAAKTELIRKIKKCTQTIAKERDYLRMLINDAEEICCSCDEAVNSLETAADLLSQYL